MTDPMQNTQENILELRDVRTYFPIHTGFLVKKHVGDVRAVDGVTLSVRQGEVLGLVGESGCGKSTLARTILQLVPTTGGAVVLSGRNLGKASRAEMLACRIEYPDAARAGDVDVAPLVALHAVDDAVPKFAVADVLGEDAAVAEGAVGGDIEDANVGARGIVDVEKFLVRRKAQAVTLAEIVRFEVKFALR